MSRLTEQVWFKDIKGDVVGHLNSNGFEYFVKQDISQQRVVNKLGQLEDVLEEFEIESAEELRERLAKAIVPKFEIGDYFEIFWNGECLLYQYEGDKKFKCLNKTQGYLCDYIILGMLLTDNPSIDKITQAEAQAKLDEIRSGVK